MTTIHLIDALPYVYRAYFSLPQVLKDPSGRQKNAVVGFVNFLVRYIHYERPTHMAICFDQSRSNNFRNKIYPQYKSNRESPSEELRGQMNRCREVSEAFGLACYDDEEYEADDLIATLAKPLVSAGHSCTVVSNDKDLCQLVGPQVEMYNYGKAQRYDEIGVRNKLGVMPSQVPDYLGLVGDPVDCIPGVRGLGPKTARCLLDKYRGLEEIYAELQEVSQLGIRGSQGIADKLGSQREQAFLSRELATVSDSATLEGGGALNSLKCNTYSKRQLSRLLPEFGLSERGYAFRKLELDSL